jgi:hypothetical protein
LKTVLQTNRALAVKAYFNTAREFVIEFDLSNSMQRYAAVKTNLDGLKTKTVKLRELTASYGEENVQNWIRAWLLTLVCELDVTISSIQVQTTSILLLEILYMANISEFNLFFKKVISGDMESYTINSICKKS